MNFLEIYKSLSEVREKLFLRGESSVDYIKGFSDCLHLLKRAFKNAPSLNLAIENTKLKKEAIERENALNKQITELKILLDDEAYRLSGLEKLLQTKYEEVEPLKLARVELFNYHLNQGFRTPIVLQTNAPKQIVDFALEELIVDIVKVGRNVSDEKLGNRLVGKLCANYRAVIINKSGKKKKDNSKSLLVKDLNQKL